MKKAIEITLPDSFDFRGEQIKGCDVAAIELNMAGVVQSVTTSFLMGGFRNYIRHEQEHGRSSQCRPDEIPVIPVDMGKEYKCTESNDKTT